MPEALGGLKCSFLVFHATGALAGSLEAPGTSGENKSRRVAIPGDAAEKQDREQRHRPADGESH